MQSIFGVVNKLGKTFVIETLISLPYDVEHEGSLIPLVLCGLFRL